MYLLGIDAVMGCTSNKAQLNNHTHSRVHSMFNSLLLLALRLSDLNKESAT